MGISREDITVINEKLDKLLVTQAEQRQYLVDQRPRCDSHAKDIQSLKTWRSWLTGAWAASSAIFGAIIGQRVMKQ